MMMIMMVMETCYRSRQVPRRRKFPMGVFFGMLQDSESRDMIEDHQEKSHFAEASVAFVR